MSLKNCLIVAYQESCNVKEVTKKLIYNGNVESCAYILHNLDIDENGQLKKSHYHIYIKFNKPTTKKQVAKHFNVSENLVQSALNPNGIIRYFLHLDDKEKTQYKKEAIYSYGLDIENLLSRSSLGTQDEILILKDLITKIRSNYTLIELLDYVLKNNYFYVYRANYSILRDIARTR